MARCEEMKLLLGPFEDGELEAHEMQEVARHLAGCANCEGELADYRTFAVALRGASSTPSLAGFSNAVTARIDQLPVPFGRRLRRYVTSFADGIGATFATGFAAAAVAVITAVILTPYFRQGQFFNSGHPLQVAMAAPNIRTNAPQEVAKNDASPVIPPLARNDTAGAGGDLQPASTTEDSGTIIDRLDSPSPSVAVWSEPKSDTTVIWVPDQQR